MAWAVTTLDGMNRQNGSSFLDGVVDPVQRPSRCPWFASRRRPVAPSTVSTSSRWPYRPARRRPVGTRPRPTGTGPISTAVEMSPGQSSTPSRSHRFASRRRPAAPSTVSTSSRWPYRPARRRRVSSTTSSRPFNGVSPVPLYAVERGLSAACHASTTSSSRLDVVEPVEVGISTTSRTSRRRPVGVQRGRGVDLNGR